MRIRKKIYGWFILAVAFSIGLALIADKPSDEMQAIGTILRTLLSIVPILLFLEYGLLIRILRIFKFMDSGQPVMGTRVVENGNDELTEIATHLTDQFKIIKTQKIEIEELNEQLAFLVEDAPILVQRFDSKGIIKFINNTYATHFDVTKEEAVGRSIFDFIRSKGYDFNLEDDLKRLTARKPVSQGVYSRRSSRGWLMWINRAIFDNNGRIKEYQTIGVDITHQKESEERLGFVYDSMTLLTSVDLVNIKPAISDLLKKFGRFMDADTVRIALFDDKNVRQIETWSSSTCCPCEIDGDVNSSSWWSTQFSMSENDYIIIEDVSKISPMEVSLGAQPNNLKRVIAVPVAFNHTYIGVMCIEIVSSCSRKWTTADAMTARLVGRLVGTVLRPIVNKTDGAITVDKNTI